MKAVIKLLLLIVLAVAVGVALQDTTGYISLVINDERRTVSLVVGVLFLVNRTRILKLASLYTMPMIHSFLLSLDIFKVRLKKMVSSMWSFRMPDRIS